MIQKINKAVENGFDFGDPSNEDENEIHPIDCKYYSTEKFNEQNINSIKHFSLLHLNIHSMEFHIDEFRIALELLNLTFDIICITESKIRKNVGPKTDISIVDYQTPVGTPTEATKGGVLIYVKNGINFKPREDLNMYKSKELESYFIEAINDQGENIVIGSIYRHPCMDQSLFIDEYLQPLNDKLLNENKKVFLAGDFNFDLLNADSNETFNFFEGMMSCHLLPIITIPTKINPKKSTVIDNIFTSEIQPDMLSGNLTVPISDHLPSFFIIPRDNQNHIPKKHNIYTRKTKDFDKVSFIGEYVNINWSTILETNMNDVNLSLQIFLNKINELLDKYMPLRKLTKKEYKRRFKPWISDLIFVKIEKKMKISGST